MCKTLQKGNKFEKGKQSFRMTADAVKDHSSGFTCMTLMSIRLTFFYLSEQLRQDTTEQMRV